MDVKKNCNYASRPDRYSGCKRCVIFQSEKFIFDRPRHPVFKPKNNTKGSMAEHAEEQKYFYETDDRIGNEKITVRFVHFSAIIRKQKKIADEVLHEKDYEKQSCETHQYFFANRRVIEFKDTVHRG